MVGMAALLLRFLGTNDAHRQTWTWARSGQVAGQAAAPPEVDSNGDSQIFGVMTTPGSFTTDVAAIRMRAREHLDQGALTPNYGGDVDTTISLLNDAVATEIVCVLRYPFHAI